MARTDPRVDDPRNNQYRIRLSDAELSKLDYCVKHTGKTKAEIIREGIEIIYRKITEGKNEKEKRDDYENL
jgi:hypothetical protein